jgi:hypothetical protein
LEVEMERISTTKMVEGKGSPHIMVAEMKRLSTTT